MKKIGILLLVTVSMFLFLPSAYVLAQKNKKNDKSKNKEEEKERKEWKKRIKDMDPLAIRDMTEQ
ncbi:MAG: hypothetical protein RMJ89_13340, partial [Flammeovirgaceae bacterium]|nr:hypothetical protein [Flammeovirgaceae bacterium]